jgi:hypothetical protein
MSDHGRFKQQRRGDRTLPPNRDNHRKTGAIGESERFIARWRTLPERGSATLSGPSKRGWVGIVTSCGRLTRLSRIHHPAPADVSSVEPVSALTARFTGRRSFKAQRQRRAAGQRSSCPRGLCARPAAQMQPRPPRCQPGSLLPQLDAQAACCRRDQTARDPHGCPTWPASHSPGSSGLRA